MRQIKLPIKIKTVKGSKKKAEFLCRPNEIVRVCDDQSSMSGPEPV